MKSTAYNEKKKNAIPPPMMATHAAICLILDIIINLINILLNLFDFQIIIYINRFYKSCKYQSALKIIHVN